MQIANLIMALPGAAAQGLIWGIMAIGVYLTFRVLDIADRYHVYRRCCLRHDDDQRT